MFDIDIPASTQVTLEDFTTGRAARVSGPDFLAVDADIDLIGLALFLVMCGAGSVVFEIGRKIRAPADEAPGVETYTCLWGAPRAVAIWLAANAIAVACCLALAVHLAFTLPALTIVTGLGMVVAVVAIRFLQFPTRQSAAIVEVVSGVANVLVLITAGILPWLVPL